MGARLGHVAVFVVVLIGGCTNRLNVPDERPAERPAVSLPIASSIPEPTPSTQPYADADADVPQVAETFVRAALEYDATSDEQTAFLGQVAPITTPVELARLRKSPRAHLDWRALATRNERVAVAITGISVSQSGRVMVEVEETTRTSFGTVRDFVQVILQLVADGSALKVARADGGGL
jgi:hypothetical protein